MKKIRLLMGGFIGLMILSLVSCEKEATTVDAKIDGTYVGKLIKENTLKSAMGDTLSGDATAIITLIDSTQIKFHCFGSSFDSTLVLNLFDGEDSLFVCLTGNDFNHEYGHMMGHGNGMMENGMGMGWGHMATDTTTLWGKHLYYNHKTGDMHFGGFNHMDHSFDFAFKMMNHNSIYYLKFHGVKK
jgi:hypothetical protein